MLPQTSQFAAVVNGKPTGLAGCDNTECLLRAQCLRSTPGLPRVIAVTDRALRGDAGAIEQPRLLGNAFGLVGGVDALGKLQGARHDQAVERWRQGSRGYAVSTWWEHSPKWAAL